MVSGCDTGRNRASTCARSAQSEIVAGGAIMPVRNLMQDSACAPAEARKLLEAVRVSV